MGKLKRTQFCLSYHIRGSCFANCGRQADYCLHQADYCLHKGDQTKRLAVYLAEAKALASA
jgi:hypothetical protein